MNITLRLEQPSDYRETENVTREAFWNHFAPRCDEHYLLHIMRECPAFVPELDIVAVCGDKIVGNVVCVKGLLKGDDGSEYEVLSLGPISVLPEYQRKGIGGQMIEQTRKLASEMGFRAICLLGDPDYYSRQGFVPAETLGVRTADDMYLDAFQICVLHESAMFDTKCRYFEDAIYDIDKASAESFDKSFPAKEVVTGTPSQKRFDLLVSMHRKAFPENSDA